MSDPSCVFCKIVAGQIPCACVFQDDATFAFLDINPLAEGHLLVIPKRHIERLEQMPAESLMAVTRHLPMLGQAVMKVVGATAYSILQNNGRESGQDVPHVHFHIIPRRAADGLGYRWNASKYAPGRAEQVHQRLLAALKR
ncbi:MAG: HIT family protein [Phycisphaerae bacterium]|jgi:histidine triad (HIT) family protein|nr:HIT family protein [Phycisphaerae bacterium]